MDLDITIGAQIQNVEARATMDKLGVIRRTCRITLAREFDTVLASALGRDAKKTLALLEVGSIATVTLPIDAIVAQGVLRAMSQECTIPLLRGVAAKGKAGDPDEDEQPSIKLEFEFDWEERAWVFLGRNLSAQADVTIRSIQTENALASWKPDSDDKDEDDRPKRARKGARA